MGPCRLNTIANIKNPLPGQAVRALFPAGATNPCGVAAVICADRQYRSVRFVRTMSDAAIERESPPDLKNAIADQ
jgi:hypothetical protein